mmetsp:Transcript_12906/g.21833  ORF Transcript_12906/g.21833 Transcript_12906/m.21833 type:complete len:89 (+) Transcript_12906:3-269(+)
MSKLPDLSEFKIGEERVDKKNVFFPPESASQHGMRKFNLKRNIYELVEMWFQCCPYRCPKTGSALIKSNFIYMTKLNALFVVSVLIPF